MQIERECCNCGAFYKVWEYGVIYAPRTDETAGWLNRQCEKCFAIGGIDVEETQMMQELIKLNDEKESIKTKSIEIRRILAAIKKKSVMTIGAGE